MNQNRLPSLMFAAVLCLAALLLQSCVGWGDMFAEKRWIVGPYFLMTSEGTDSPQYFLFRHGESGSITGPIKAIGWNEKFVIVRDDASKRGWDIFPVAPDRDSVPQDEAKWRDLQQALVRSVKLRSGQEVWNQAG